MEKSFHIIEKIRIKFTWASYVGADDSHPKIISYHIINDNEICSAKFFICMALIIHK